MFFYDLSDDTKLTEMMPKKLSKTSVLYILISLLILSPLWSQGKRSVTDSGERVKETSQIPSIRKSSEFKDLNWQYIGPTNISGRCTDVEGILPS